MSNHPFLAISHSVGTTLSLFQNVGLTSGYLVLINTQKETYVIWVLVLTDLSLIAITLLEEELFDRLKLVSAVDRDP